MSRAAPTWWHRVLYTRATDALRGRFDASLHWQSALAGADLPDQVADVIEQVVRRSRLWRSEKVDVAQELAAHFQDGLEAGRTPRQLVESFGDPAQAARLIRRAKKRGRSVLWHLAVWTGRALAAFVIFYFVMAFYYLLGRPSPHIDYLSGFNELAHSVPVENQAWLMYRQALLALDCRSEVERPTPSTLARDARPGDAKWPQAVRFLRDHASALAKLREATAVPHLGYEIGHQVAAEDQPLLGNYDLNPVESNIPHPPLYEVLLPHLQALRAGGRLLESDIFRAVEADEAEIVYADLVALVKLSRHCAESPFLVSGLMALAVDRQACRSLEYVLTERPELLSDRQLADLAHELAAQKFDGAVWLESERIAFYDFIQRIYSDDGHGDGSITYPGLKYLSVWTARSESFLPSEVNSPLHNRTIALGMPIAATVMSSRKEIEEKVDELFVLAKNDLSAPIWDEDENAAEKELVRMERSPVERFRYLLIALLMPATNAAKNAIEQERGFREGALVGIALELYRRQHDGWPESLDDLAPRWIPAVPIDRINGGPLGYRIVDNRPVVYSMGIDTDDDDGRLPEVLEGDGWNYRVSAPQPSANSGLYDGDWLIWSTVRNEARGARSE